MSSVGVERRCGLAAGHWRLAGGCEDGAESWACGVCMLGQFGDSRKGEGGGLCQVVWSLSSGFVGQRRLASDAKNRAHYGPAAFVFRQIS